MEEDQRVLQQLSEEVEAAEQRGVDLENELADENEKVMFDLHEEMATVEQRLREVYWLLQRGRGRGNARPVPSPCTKGLEQGGSAGSP